MRSALYIDTSQNYVCAGGGGTAMFGKPKSPQGSADMRTRRGLFCMAVHGYSKARLSQRLFLAHTGKIIDFLKFNFRNII